MRGRTSGVARFFGAWGQQSQWLSLTEIMNLRKSQLFIEFPYITLNNLKFVERRKSNFSFKIFCCPICCPFGGDARGGRTPPPVTLLRRTVENYFPNALSLTYSTCHMSGTYMAKKKMKFKRHTCTALRSSHFLSHSYKRVWG